MHFYKSVFLSLTLNKKPLLRREFQTLGSIRTSAVGAVDLVELLSDPHERGPLGHLLDLAGADVGASCKERANV